ncbi:TPA: type II toxin-antitoxin system HicA family toxin [Streptococcus pyogenes]
MPLTGKEMAKIAKENGWYEIRKKGSHHHFKKDGIPYIVTIPIHGNKDLGNGLEKKILKDLGLK